MSEEEKPSETSLSLGEKLVDRDLVCKTCQKSFLWSAREQIYYQKKGFKKQPQKCASCREKANKLRDSGMFYIHCGLCDKDATMLTPPPRDRVAVCEECFNKLLKKFSRS